MPETLLYEGKAKRVFATEDGSVLLHRYKDDATAFNAQKRGSWKDKGKTNATMSAAMFVYLEANGVPSHFIEQVDETTIKTKRLTMLPVEVVVRNVAAGSLSRLLGFEEGRPLRAPIIELCYKNDSLGDPLLNWHHFRELGVGDADRKLVLADEISPDTCRFWDRETGERLDKDRFRRDLGGMEEAYAEMLRRVVEPSAVSHQQPAREGETGT